MPGCFLAPYEAWRERHTWVLRKLPPVGIHKCKPQKLILEDLGRKGISGKDTGKLSASWGRREKQTWLPPWERLRLVWCGPCCPHQGTRPFGLPIRLCSNSTPAAVDCCWSYCLGCPRDRILLHSMATVTTLGLSTVPMSLNHWLLIQNLMCTPLTTQA